MLRRLKIDWDDLAKTTPLDTPFPAPEPGIERPEHVEPSDFPDFLDAIGHVGMGGSGFRTAEKIRKSRGAHTLVINGVECEPGLSIDKSVLLHESERVLAGAGACAAAVGAQRILLAVHNDDALIARLKPLYEGIDIIRLPRRYPAGAEKLILKKLIGRSPAPGTRPYQYGYLMQNAVSLRAVGRALTDGIPVVERPLTLAMPSARFYRNLIAPIGLAAGELLKVYNLPYEEEHHLIIDSGLMMGHEVGPLDAITKTTLSLLIIEREGLERKEKPCIRCGACYTACPLGLHPFALTESVRRGKTGSAAVRAQLSECFLCGVCSAVCPSDIPLVQQLQEGRKCL